MPARTLRMRCSSLVLLLMLAGCSALPPVQRQESPCDRSEASYECQIQRYHDVSVG
ncbi:hypothetical protein [Ramlibacter sp.]|uniref:hypothetical protein n=1 Tax=Ramlibacter sp. TaxID=1917967 RepID=UPI002D758F56|nr:hypothetical protein [Ramlibacter sp.]HYD75168.1 hypothetical protein [Ramlibacter sp.]